MPWYMFIIQHSESEAGMLLEFEINLGSKAKFYHKKETTFKVLVRHENNGNKEVKLGAKEKLSCLKLNLLSSGGLQFNSRY